MSNLNWQNYITFDSMLCHGKPCIHGTRTMISIILDYLYVGELFEDLLKQYSSLKKKDIQAATGYAAWLAHEEDPQPFQTSYSLCL